MLWLDQYLLLKRFRGKNSFHLGLQKAFYINAKPTTRKAYDWGTYQTAEIAFLLCPWSFTCDAKRP
jgi:hypothetical protein